MLNNIIAILTDFGLQDQYVASMKGVILSINPKIKIVDITHEVLPHRIKQAGFVLWSVYKYFPKGTIFISVVDPGVGSKRSILAVKSKDFIFLSPDNGLLDFIIAENTSAVKIQVHDEYVAKYLPKKISSTFHGRDIFAPLAAYISNGLQIKKIGKSIKKDEIVSPFINTREENSRLCILNIDRFGNIITNFLVDDFGKISKDVKAISVGRNLVNRWVRFYEEAPENTPFLILGSNNLIEISVKNKNAAHFLNATLDTPIKIY